MSANLRIVPWGGLGEVGPRVMRERDALSQSGFVTAVFHYDRNEGRLVGEPRTITRGFVFRPGSEDLLSRAQEVVRSAASVSEGTDPEEVEGLVEGALSRLFYCETGRRPVVAVAAVSDQGLSICIRVLQGGLPGRVGQAVRCVVARRSTPTRSRYVHRIPLSIVTELLDCAARSVYTRAR